MPFRWGKCKLATASFGHGITTTLLQLAKGYSIISNGGFNIKPMLVKREIKENKKDRILNKDVSEKINPILREGNMKAPVVSELANQLNLDPKALEKFLIKTAKLGKVRQVAKNRFLLPEAVVSLAEIAAALGKSNGESGFSAAEFRDQTNIGRNLAIEILEFFDKSGLTWRSGDTRKVLKTVSQIFGTN